MNKLKIFLLFFCLLTIQQTNVLAQKTTSNQWWILPSTLVGLGLVSSSQGIKDFQSDIHAHSFSGFQTQMDDFLQYSPTLINIGLSIAHPNPQTRNAKIGRFFLGSLSYALVTQGLKRTLEVTRPNGGEHSFPSGHVATAFFGAHLLAKETAKDKPWIGYLGYGLATSTAFLRMANNEHWLSDVMVGAGIGIAAAEFSSYMYPKLAEKWNKKHAYHLNPMLGNQYYAIQFTMNLNY